jgi:FG-GAP repeat/FG-GAP-like repeat
MSLRRFRFDQLMAGRASLAPALGAALTLMVVTIAPLDTRVPARLALSPAVPQAEVSSAAPAARTAGSNRPDLAAVPGASEAWWTQVSANLERQEYEADAAGDGVFEAPNPAQRFRIHYRPAGIEIVPRAGEGAAAGSPTGASAGAHTETPAWRFGWRTSRWGRAGSMEAIDPERATVSVSTVASGSRVLYEHRGAGLVEWYENTKAGLEQGFTIAEPPLPGAAGASELAVEGQLTDGLRPELRADGAVDLIDLSGACVLHYGEPHTFDAHGREIESWLSVSSDEQTLSIVVADAGAAYPLTIDPLLSSPSWIAESNQDESSFGASVATAGDVNGDGYSDVVVGAPAFDNGQDNEGRAFLFLGSASGLSSSPAWTSEANQADASWGGFVAPAGDVNGDGFWDVIIGASAFDNGQVDEGRAAVYLGSASGLAASPSWTAESNQAGAQLGPVATAGDVNGDGFSDVIVGAPSYDNGPSVGRAFAYLGSASGLAATPSWFAETNQASIFGFSVGTAGDVNADGFADVIVGAFFYANGQSQEGGAFVYLGSASGLQATPAWTAESNQASARFGYSVGTAGDVNGDGYSDVVVGAPLHDNLEIDEGRAFVYLGGASGLQSSPAWTAEPNQFTVEFGSSVGTAGDTNGDGFADVLIGAHLYNSSEPDAGRVYLYEGSAAGLPAGPTWFVDGNQFTSDFGGSVATAGDVNGDGFSDVIIGARHYSSGHSQEGRAFVYQGAATGLAINAGWENETNRGGSFYGAAVATAGDVNGDGFSDVVVGAPWYGNGQSAEGGAFLYLGSATGLASTPAWTGESNQATALYGQSVASAGDVNGDGYSDVIVGALLYDNETEAEGRVYVYHGSPAGLSVAPSWIVESNHFVAYFGQSVASAGDVNGDGFADVVIGALNYDNDQVDEGRVFVYHGSASGLAPTPAWTAESNQVNAHYGYSVASAGDVNGDRFSDVVVGAYVYDNGQTNEGRAYLYLGSAAGLAATPAWTAEGNQAEAFYGRSVASAGDVNGDGYSDVVVGALFYDNDQLDEGRVFVYHGSPLGLGIGAAWTAESNQEFANYGHSVASAGDVNGDRFSDIIVGATLFANGQFREGRAFAYQGSAAGLLASPVWTAESNQSDSDFGFSVASAGDVNGDGFADALIGAPQYNNPESNEGHIWLHYGNSGDGLDRIPRQARTGDQAPIDILGRSDAGSGFRLKALGRTPGGRGRVRLVAEVKQVGIPFSGTGLTNGSFSNTGQPGASGSAIGLAQIVSGLTPETLYHWRTRIATDSPYFPHSPWLSLPYNAPSEADVRTGSATAAVDGGAANPASAALRDMIEPNAPNPFSAETQIAYRLTQGGRHRLAVYDVQGRQVALLADGVEPAGRHSLRWNARDRDGRQLAAGIYFLRLELNGRVESRKMVITR